jgi:hypothetical protein
VEQLPVERVLVAIHGVDAHQVVGQNGAANVSRCSGLDAADRGEEARVGAHVEILVAQLGGNRGGELAERLAVLDEDVEVLGGIGSSGEARMLRLPSARAPNSMRPCIQATILLSFNCATAVPISSSVVSR